MTCANKPTLKISISTNNYFFHVEKVAVDHTAKPIKRCLTTTIDGSFPNTGYNASKQRDCQRLMSIAVLTDKNTGIPARYIALVNNGIDYSTIDMQSDRTSRFTNNAATCHIVKPANLGTIANDHGSRHTAQLTRVAIIKSMNAGCVFKLIDICAAI